MREKEWWQDKIAYQIYPQSFNDTNGDGIGDLCGIIEKLDYLKDLGVDVLWISPCYPSPLADQGYDISDYYNIDPRFGTLEDMDRLLQEAKKRGLYVLMDLVVNHCSDEHGWFQKACADPEGKYGKYFYLAKSQDGKHPTNWRSIFGGSAWEEIPGTDYEYLHMFHKKQPDLNWENPEVREEIYTMINWWLDRGLDGFRIDAIINIKKALPMHDYPADREDGMCSISNELDEAKGIGVFLNEMKERTFAPHNALSVAEIFFPKTEDIISFIGENGYFSTMFDFRAFHSTSSPNGWYDEKRITPNQFRDCTFESQRIIGTRGFFSNVIENHDEPRGVSNYIPDEDLCNTTKKLLAMEYFFLRGIPFIYQGQELGMENLPFSDINEINDVSTLDQIQVAMAAGYSQEDAIQACAHNSRDNSRSPMQWDSTDNAGFTTGKPWLRVNPNYKLINAASQMNDPDSLLSFYKKMIQVRKDPSVKDILVYGELIPYLETEDNLMAYLRKSEDGTQTILVAGNFSKEKKTIKLPSPIKNILLNNINTIAYTDDTLTLEGYQGVVCE